MVLRIWEGHKGGLGLWDRLIGEVRTPSKASLCSRSLSCPYLLSIDDCATRPQLKLKEF